MKFKSGKHKSKRGGKSQLLTILCQKCTCRVLYYQKNGPGGLRRMYMDRIIKPLPCVCKKNQHQTTKAVLPLCCAQCDELLGYPIIYKKENRPAYRLFVDSVIKKRLL